jgi:hypothetical protein
MSLSTDIERVQSKSLRKRQRIVRETALLQGLSDPHKNDLARTVDANQKKSAQKAKLNRLRRN